MMRALLLSAIVIALAGCAASLKVTQISPIGNPGQEVDGVPFRVPRAYAATLYKLSDPKGAAGAYKPASTAPPLSVVAPDMDRLYVLGFDGQLFSNPTVNVALNSDNTISSVSLSTASSAQAALTALGTQATAVNGALVANGKSTAAATATYYTGVTAYYTAMQTYCTASKATPLDVNAVRTAAAGVLAAETSLAESRSAVGVAGGDTPALPYTRLINPQSDVGLGCA